MKTTDSDAIKSPGLERSSKYFPIRRSTRLPLEIPLRVTSLDPKSKFGENCNTVTVSAHGCGLVSPRALPTGTRVTLELVAEKQSTTARVLEVVPLDEQNTSWLLGMEMECPGNFWGIKYAPADWSEVEEENAASVTAPANVAAKPAPAGKTAAAATAAAPSATKKIPDSIMRRLLTECRLAAISLGACYVQTGRTFPTHAPVNLIMRVGKKEHLFRGTVRVEHVGSGMGIEFSARDEAHSNRIAALIDALSAGEGELHEVRVELGTPDKSVGKSLAAPAATTAGDDSLLGLVLAGGALKRNAFLQELEKQRRRA